MAFRAYASGDCCTRETAREAASEFFAQFPNRRKCNVTEGKIEGDFFVVAFSSNPKVRGRSFKDVTKKMVDTLPTD